MAHGYQIPATISLTIMQPKTVDLGPTDQLYLDLCCKHGEIVPAIKWLRMWHDLGLKEAKDLWDEYRNRYESKRWKD
jgi:hypothetical protein